jgi:hypothetical protein
MASGWFLNFLGASPILFQTESISLAKVSTSWLDIVISFFFHP